MTIHPDNLRRYAATCIQSAEKYETFAESVRGDANYKEFHSNNPRNDHRTAELNLELANALDEIADRYLAVAAKSRELAAYFLGNLGRA